MPTDDGGPAYPHQGRSQSGDPCEEVRRGKTLLDSYAENASEFAVSWFLGRYLESAKVNDPEFWETPDWSQVHMEQVASIEARYRYALAQAMLAEKRRLEKADGA